MCTKLTLWKARRIEGLVSDGFRGQVDEQDIYEALRNMVMAVPSFSARDGFIKGSAGRGHIIGERSQGQPQAAAVALIYYSLLADMALDTFPDLGDIVVDGNITSQRMFGSLLAGLRRQRQVLFSEEKDGTLIGAALFAGISQNPRSPLTPKCPAGIDTNLLAAYKLRWRGYVDRAYPRPKSASPATQL